MRLSKPRQSVCNPFVLFLVSLQLSILSATGLQSAEVSLSKNHKTFFESYCLECHDSQTREGSVDLETLPLQITNLEHAESWQKVLNVLNSGEMPPEDSNQPGNVEKTDLLEALAKTMVNARRRLSDAGGKITMRRLNRREYRNTIEQLTGAKINVDALPSDGGSGTFDTVGSSQFISSDQFEQYLELGRQAIDESLERLAAQKTGPKVFRVEPETTVNVRSLAELQQLEETNERFMAWKSGVDKAAEAPENKEIVAAILQENPNLDLKAWPSASAFLFYRHASRLKGIPDPRSFGFKDDNDATFSFQGGYARKHSYIKHYSELPHSDRGTYLKLTWGIQRIDVTPKPKDMPPGTYRMRIRAGTVDGSPSHRHFIQIGHPQRVNQVPAGFASLPISSHQVTGTIDQPEIIETLLEVSEGTQKEFGIQERQPTNGKSLRDAYNRDKKSNGYGTPPAVWIDWIELEGPLQEAGQVAPFQRIWEADRKTRGKSESARARKILSEFSSASFRIAEPDALFIDKLIAIFEARRQAGDSFEIAIRTPLSIILASPGFLYLNEPGFESKKRTLNDQELAVRLSYFLWSTGPDRELLQIAKSGELHQPEVLREQVDRLIADPRSDEFISGFVHQWLDMERLDFFQFDAKLHREFDENTRAAARQEVYHSFAYLLRSSDSGRLGELLKSDFVHINGLLADYYSIDGVTGDRFRRVKLPENSPRGGLLGMAAIHAMGSDGVVSSPVERGAWVLRHLLHDPPPPAPPNVPQISRLDGQILTTRERLLAHQEQAQCASCHRKIDPIGFGMENFDAAGKWRIEDSYQVLDRKGRGVGKRKTWPIDDSGSFHQGPSFNDFQQLRDLISTHENEFAHGMTEHLIEYGLGRPFGFTDQTLAEEIVNAAKSKDYSVSEFIHALVLSESFRTK